MSIKVHEKKWRTMVSVFCFDISRSFVDSFWFALMTLTTVGYDLNPATMLGKVTGGFCALLGVFILTLPIPIVVNSFASYYKNRLWRNEVWGFFCWFL